MRKLLFILLFFVSFISFAQDGTQYNPTVAWKTQVNSVIYLNTDTFSVDVDPIDYNDPGAINRTIGGYLMDNFGHIYTIIDSTSTTITVVDEFDYNVAPVEGEIGIVYKSVGNGNAPYIAPVLYEFLDDRAKQNADRLFKDILWKEAHLYAQDSASLATETWVLSQIPDSVQNSNLHVEAARLEDLTSRSVTVAFADTFLNQPIGEEPQIYRIENFKGNYRRSKLLWGWTDASQPTNTGFSLNIDSSEPLANVILEYIYVEIIKSWILEGGIWNDNNYWIDTEVWID